MGCSDGRERSDSDGIRQESIGQSIFSENEKGEIVLTDEQAEKIKDILSKSKVYYDSLVAQGDINPIQKTIDWLMEDAKEISGGIWVKYKAGEREAIIFTHSE